MWWLLTELVTSLLRLVLLILVAYKYGGVIHERVLRPLLLTAIVASMSETPRLFLEKVLWLLDNAGMQTQEAIALHHNLENPMLQIPFVHRSKQYIVFLPYSVRGSKRRVTFLGEREGEIKEIPLHPGLNLDLHVPDIGYEKIRVETRTSRF